MPERRLTKSATSGGGMEESSRRNSIHRLPSTSGVRSANGSASTSASAPSSVSRAVGMSLPAESVWTASATAATTEASISRVSSSAVSAVLTVSTVSGIYRLLLGFAQQRFQAFLLFERDIKG